MNDTQYIDLIKEFLAACRTGKEIVSQMPELPPGITPRHVRVVDMIHKQLAEHDEVRVSDIADSMNVTRPSVTKLINHLVEAGYLQKMQKNTDHRVYTLSFTVKGEQLYDRYVRQYFKWVADRLKGIDTDDIRTTIAVIGYAEKALSGQKEAL